MRVKQVALAMAALGLLGLLTACSNEAAYTLVNETNQELITWPLLHHCDALAAHEGDYLDEDVVMPHSTLDYSYISWFPEPKCVQVVTKNRHLVLSEPYESGGTYTVREPLRPLSTQIPKESELPRRPFTEGFMDAPILFSLELAVWSGICVGIVAGTFLGTRFLYRRFRAEASTVRGGVFAAAAVATAGAWLGVLWWWLWVFWVDMPLGP